MWSLVEGSLELLDALQTPRQGEREDGRIDLLVSHSDKRSSEMLIDIRPSFGKVFGVWGMLLALEQFVQQHFCVALSLVD